MCPEVKMSEVHFLEPLDENGERDDDEAVQLSDNEKDENATGERAASGQGDKLNVEGEGAAKISDDEEEPSDPSKAKKLDDENM